MSKKQSLFNTKTELETIHGWKHRIENPEVTHLKPILGKKSTRFNSWYQSLVFENSVESQKQKITIGRQASHIHALQHLTLFTKLDMKVAKTIINLISFSIKTTNGTTQLFQFTFDQYFALMNLLNITKNTFYVPFQYFVFGKQLFHCCYEHFIAFEIELQLSTTSNIFPQHINSMCYTMGETELQRMIITPHSYLVNKYFNVTHESQDSIFSFDLNYTQPIRSIVAYNYSVENDLCVNLNHMPFYGSYDNIPHFYGDDSEENLFDYLKHIDKELHNSIIANCDHHMYFKALDINSHFMDVNDCYNKIMPTNIAINIESACGSKIGQISFLLQFVVELQLEENCKYARCVRKQQHNPISYPLTKISDTHFIEGYWQEYNECGCCNPLIYPFPVNSGVHVDKVFQHNLEHIKQYCKVEHYYGSSMCRLCDLPTGNSEYSFKSEGKTYVFPEGITHYYSMHNVQPSDEFVEAVEQYVVETE